MAFWAPTTTVDEAARQRGLRAFEADGICSQVRDSLLGGPLLVGYALLLGASHITIGLLAAIGPVTQILQLPTVALIEHWRARKAITWWAALAGRICLLGVIAVPWALPPSLRLSGLFAALTLSACFGTISSAAWTPWIRDFLPEESMGRLFARRLALATGASAVLGLAAGYAIDALPAVIHPPAAAYTVVFGVGVAAALLGLLFLARIPEPLMPPQPRRPWIDIFRAPLMHREFRPVMVFLACWTFAVNLTAPFFSVYLLQRLGLSMTWVVGLTVLSQATSALMIRAWGAAADRFHTLTVLRVSGVGFLLAIAAWPFVNLVPSAAVVKALLLAIHVFAGLTTAGVSLCTSTVAMRCAPRGEAAAYLATNALVSGAAAAVAPLLAGISAAWLETQRLTLTLQWTSSAGAGRILALRPLDFHGLDFLWLGTVVLGLYAIHRLLALPEGQAGSEREVIAAMAAEVRLRLQQPMRVLSTVPAIRDVIDFPWTVLYRLVPERRSRPRTAVGSGS